MTPPLSPTAPPARRSVRGAWLVLGGLITVTVLALGGFTAWQVITGGGIAQHTEQTSSTVAGTPETLVVGGTSASVELRGAEVEDVTADLDLTWYSAEPVVEPTWAGSDLLVELYCRSTGIPIWFLPECSIDYAAQVPGSAAAAVDLSSGSITVQDINGDINLQTRSGDIRASGLASAAVVSTDSGHIALEFTEAPERIEAETTSGDVQISVPRGESYRILTNRSIDDIDTEVATDPESNFIIDLRSDHGRITVDYSD